MKLYIIGPSGAGKTYLGKKLSAATGVPVTSLDDLFWNNTSFTKRDPAQRDALLSEVLRRDSWILEGVQHAWLGEAFRQADGTSCWNFRRCCAGCGLCAGSSIGSAPARRGRMKHCGHL